MAYIDIDIEDYLNEVDTRYLIRELKLRAKNGELKNELDDIIDELGIECHWPAIESVLDQQRRDWVNENWERIPL